MSYKTLEKILYADQTSNRFTHAASVLQERLNSESTFRTGIQLRTGELFLAVPRELSQEIEHLLRLERRVSALWKTLPKIALHAYVSSLILDEVMFSNEIEGIHSTRREVEIALEEARAAERKPSRSDGNGNPPFVELAKLYLGLTDNPKVPQTLQDIRDIFEGVVRDAIDSRDVPRSTLFRRGPVVIEDGRGRVRHEGVDPQEVEHMLTQWLELSNSDDMPEVYNAILCHFLFGYIHPFYDGNGRTGRYLLALHLSRVLSEPTVLSLSRTIAENKNVYYKAFDEVERPLNHAEATSFVLTMIYLLSRAQEGLIADLENKRDLLDRLHSAMGRYEGILPGRSIDLLFHIGQMNLIGNFNEFRQTDVASSLDISIPTARAALQDLESQGLVVQVSKRPSTYRITEEAKRTLLG